MSRLVYRGELPDGYSFMFPVLASILSGPTAMAVPRETIRSDPASESGNESGKSKNMAASLANAEITEDRVQEILHIHRTSNPPQAPYGQTQVFRHQLYGLRAPLRGER